MLGIEPPGSSGAIVDVIVDVIVEVGIEMVVGAVSKPGL